MGQQEYQQYQELNQVYQEFDHQLAQLNKERDAGNISIDQYNTRLAELKQNESDTVAAVVDGYKRMNSAREDWMNGLTSSWQDYINQGKDVAGMTAQTFTDAFSGMENSMVNFV
jgi:lambda family phage tail tape measure protein